MRYELSGDQAEGSNAKEDGDSYARGNGTRDGKDDLSAPTEFRERREGGGGDDECERVTGPAMGQHRYSSGGGDPQENGHGRAGRDPSNAAGDAVRR
ncbi:MAG: hypothetical protein WCE44_14005 [Candidatus Velthaea sp.]